MHARARQYSPTLGRFVSRDPLSDRRFDAGVLAMKPYNSGAFYAVRRCPSANDVVMARVLLNLTDTTALEGACKTSIRFGRPDLAPRAGDGYQDGFSLYGGWFVPNRTDPSGLFAWNCMGFYRDCIRSIPCGLPRQAYLAAEIACSLALGACLTGEGIDSFF